MVALQMTSYSLEKVLANDRTALAFLQLFDNFKKIQGGFAWDGWYTSAKGALVLTEASQSILSMNIRKLHDPRFGLRRVLTAEEMQVMHRASGSAIHIMRASLNKGGAFAYSARSLVLLLVGTANEHGQRARTLLQLGEYRTTVLREVLQRYYPGYEQSIPSYKSKPNPHLVVATPAEVEVATQTIDVTPIDTPLDTPPRVFDRPQPVKEKENALYADAGVMMPAGDRPGYTVLAAYSPQAQEGIIEYIPFELPTDQAEMQAIALGYRTFPAAERVYTDSRNTLKTWEFYKDQNPEEVADTELEIVCLAPLIRAGIPLEHIPRDRNEVADALTKYGRDPSRSGRYKIEKNADPHAGWRWQFVPLDKPRENLPAPITGEGNFNRTFDRKLAQIRESIDTLETEIQQQQATLEALQQSRAELVGDLQLLAAARAKLFT